MATNPQDERHLKRLADTYRRRLELLQLRVAEQGYATPPEVQLEVEDIEHRIKNIGTALSPDTPNISSEGVAKLSRYYYELDLIRANFTQANSRITQIEATLKPVLYAVYAILGLVLIDVVTRLVSG